MSAKVHSLEDQRLSRYSITVTIEERGKFLVGFDVTTKRCTARIAEDLAQNREVSIPTLLGALGQSLSALAKHKKWRRKP